MVPLSLLDLAPIRQGGDAAAALRATLELAPVAERSGYRRYWLAEHHNLPGVASAATAVLIGQVAATTQELRVGAGGIMLPNHAPLVIAEQFGTLASLFPGRIDLGVGRAPGGDPLAARALRRRLAGDADTFADDVVELQSYLAPARIGQRVQAVPGAGTCVPIWILGSSQFGAQLAAALGMPYAFASHFAPAQLFAAIELYRRSFRPSNNLPQPHVMLGVNAFVADSDSEARWLSSSVKQAFLALRHGSPVPLPPPVEGFEEQLEPGERAALQDVLRCSFVGTPEGVRQGLEGLLASTGADELMVSSMIFDPRARQRSYQLLAEHCEAEAQAPSPV